MPPRECRYARYPPLHGVKGDIRYTAWPLRKTSTRGTALSYFPQRSRHQGWGWQKRTGRGPCAQRAPDVHTKPRRPHFEASTPLCGTKGFLGVGITEAAVKHVSTCLHDMKAAREVVQETSYRLYYRHPSQVFGAPVSNTVKLQTRSYAYDRDTTQRWLGGFSFFQW